MANPDTRFCSPEEYNQGKRKRVFVGDLMIGGLYRTMLRINPKVVPDRFRGAENMEAVTCLSDAEPRHNGIYVVELDLLDTDSEVFGSYRRSFRDGYLLDGTAPDFRERGYLLNHHPGLGSPALETVTVGGTDLPPDATLDRIVEFHLP